MLTGRRSKARQRKPGRFGGSLSTPVSGSSGKTPSLCLRVTVEQTEIQSLREDFFLWAWPAYSCLETCQPSFPGVKEALSRDFF